MLTSLAPSILAASIRLSGIDIANCLIRNIPNILAIPGIIIAKYVLISPMFFRVRNTGSIVTCAGIIIELSNKLKSDFLRLNRNLANAYPDIEFSSNENIVTPTEIIKLFNKYRPRFNLENKSL
jgi:hypothetical protein